MTVYEYLEYVAQVRAILDRTARNGRRRWLCARVPAMLHGLDTIGVHAPAVVEAGVDMLNLSYSYFTHQGGDLAEIRRQVPNASIYWEMCHCTEVQNLPSKIGYDCFFFRRTTPRQYWTTANLMYAQGADGMSTFNFQYYREHGTGPRGPFHEPPFEMNRQLADRDWLARQPQQYFITSTWMNWDRPERMIESPGKRHREVTLNQPTKFEFQLVPPTGGWRKGGRLRMQSPVSLGVSGWAAKLNGRELTETYDRSEPDEAPYPNLLGGNEDWRAWLVPAELLQAGVNQVELIWKEGDSSTGRQEICWVDLVVS